MTWKQYSKDYLTKLKASSSTLICEQSIETGYARCRGACCNKCNNYDDCDYNYKCTAEDVKECFS